MGALHFPRYADVSVGDHGIHTMSEPSERVARVGGIYHNIVNAKTPIEKTSTVTYLHYPSHPLTTSKPSPPPSKTPSTTLNPTKPPRHTPKTFTMKARLRNNRTISFLASQQQPRKPHPSTMLWALIPKSTCRRNYTACSLSPKMYSAVNLQADL